MNEIIELVYLPITYNEIMYKSLTVILIKNFINVIFTVTCISLYIKYSSFSSVVLVLNFININIHVRKLSNDWSRVKLLPIDHTFLSSHHSTMVSFPLHTLLTDWMESS